MEVRSKLDASSALSETVCERSQGELCPALP